MEKKENVQKEVYKEKELLCWDFWRAEEMCLRQDF